MSYYLLKQCNQISDIILPGKGAGKVWEEDSSTVLHLSTNRKDQKRLLPFYSPTFSRPVWFISRDAYVLLKKYQIGQTFRPCVLGNAMTMQQHIYYAFAPFELDCLSSSTLFSSSGEVKKLVLQEDKIGCHKVFTIAGILENLLVVDFEMLEKLLCAGVYPIEYSELACE